MMVTERAKLLIRLAKEAGDAAKFRFQAHKIVSDRFKTLGGNNRIRPNGKTF